VTISFVGEPFVSAWLAETKSPFPMLLDESRLLYHAYGLRRSVMHSWGPRNLWYYAQALASGRKMFGKRGDPNQLGGNFIVDARGVVRYAYPSHNPTDRPNIEDLLRITKLQL
jgi:alkyl hydroperoxide reductase subunit AhpC